MIDFDAQPSVKKAVARLTAGREVGTGYLVASDRLVTCHHVTRSVEADEPIECIFGDIARERRTAVRIATDAATDTAILRLDKPVSAVPLELVAARAARVFWIFGYPQFTAIEEKDEAIGVSIDGELTDPEILAPGGHRAFSVFCRQFQSAPDSVGGMSGSPVLDRGKVIGHVSSVLGSIASIKKPNLGCAFAIPAESILRILATTGVATGASSAVVAAAANAALRTEKELVDLTRILGEIDASESAAEIFGAIADAEQELGRLNQVRISAASRLIGLGLPRDAINILKDVPESPWQTELLAIALSLDGDHASAVALIRSVPVTSESKGIEGGILKRRYLATERRSMLVAAREAYSAAYEVSRNHYPGINVASCSLALGEADKSRAIAAEIAARLEAKRPREAWEESSLAEARLLCGDFAGARTQYEIAAQAHRASPRNIAVMRRQARRNLKDLGRGPGELDDVMPVPRVVAFTGHRVDPDESRGRFPPSRVARVSRTIDETMRKLDIRSGHSSAVSGADILFLEALLARDGEAFVYLPFERDIVLSCAIEPAWRARFEHVVATIDRRNVGRVVVLSSTSTENTAERKVAYDHCNLAIQQAAIDDARLLDEEPRLIAVVAATDPGDTVANVTMWQSRPEAGPVISIDPSK